MAVIDDHRQRRCYSSKSPAIGKKEGGREGGEEEKTYIAVLILVILLHGREVGDDPVQRHEDCDQPRQFIDNGEGA